MDALGSLQGCLSTATGGSTPQSQLFNHPIRASSKVFLHLAEGTGDTDTCTRPEWYMNHLLISTQRILKGNIATRYIGFKILYLII